MEGEKDDYTLAVIIPCWNCVSYIGEMLDCLLNQTFSGWNAFLVDDGCTDGTDGIIKSFVAKDSRFHYVKRDREPKGSQTCRNIGFDLSSGAEYIIFLDADDLIVRDCFEQRIDFLEKQRELDFAVFPMRSFRQDISEREGLVFGRRFVENDMEAFLNWNLPFVVVTNIYRRQSLIDSDLRWDENIRSFQDSDYNIQAILKGLRYDYADCGFDYYYRRVEDGVTKKIRTQEHYDSHLYLLNKTLVTVSFSYRNFDFYLKNRVLVFMNLMRDSKSHLIKVTKLPWVRNHRLFRLKLLILVLTKLRGEKYLFRKEVRYSRQMTKRWIAFMKNSIERA